MKIYRFYLLSDFENEIYFATLDKAITYAKTDAKNRILNDKLTVELNIKALNQIVIKDKMPYAVRYCAKDENTGRLYRYRTGYIEEVDVIE